jgi:hypothetical protein
MSAKRSKIPKVIVPLVQTFIVSKLTWGEKSFTFKQVDEDEEITIEARRFVSAHRISPTQIALSYLTRFNWRGPEEGIKTSVNDWLDRWDRPGKPPVFMRKSKLPKSR